MADITIGGISIDGNEVDVSISASVEVDSHPWILRDSALNSRSSTGHKSVEIETLSGIRVLVQGTTGTYHAVPKNNDDVIQEVDSVYALTIVSVSATAVDAAGLDGLKALYKASMEYYAKKRILLNKINDSLISYDKKKSLYQDYLNVAHSGLDVSVPGITGTDWEFTESGGLSVSYWSNGPYADIKITVKSMKKIEL